MSFAHILGTMYEHSSYHDNGFIIDELCYIISSMAFIMTPSIDRFLFVLMQYTPLKSRDTLKYICLVSQFILLQKKGCLSSQEVQ